MVNKSILFIDDDEMILKALKLRLRRQRKLWDMHFAPGSKAAFEALQGRDFDVVVCDFYMPERSGIEVLKQVREQHPKSVRIMLSGSSEESTTVQALQVAHKFMLKPFDFESLKAMIAEVFDLQGLVNNPAIRAIVGQSEGLPTLPTIYQELNSATLNPEVSAADIAKIVKKDMALSAKVLKMVNSAYFGPAQRITSIERAIAFLGTRLIRNLVPLYFSL